MSDYAQPIIFKTDAPLALKEAWIDCNGSLILKSLDGNIVIVPKECLKKITKLIRSSLRDN